MRFVDANIFIRFLTQDDPAKAAASGVLLASLERGDEEALTSESVVAEVMYVLTSRNLYGLERHEATGRLRPVIAARGVRMEQKSVILRALDVYDTYSRLDFEDALSVAHMESAGIGEIVSYDRGFDRVAEVSRVEP